jgi:D-alanine-D-alanine ligase
MKTRLRVGVIFGGRSGEHEVSLASAASVLKALDREKYEVVPIGITPEGRWISSTEALGKLMERTGAEGDEQFLVPEPNRQGLIAAEGGDQHSMPLDVVIPLVHGTFGEDGTLQGLLELANIPYVGAGVLGSAVGMDKIVQKQLFESHGLLIPAYCHFHSSEWKEAPKKVVASIEKQLRYPLFAKPANTGSSVGISKAHNRRELVSAIELAVTYDLKVIVEQGVREVREIECSVLGNEKPVASVLGEIIPSNEFYDYDAKYVDGKSTAIIPARLPSGVTKTIRRIAVEAYTLLDLTGMARVDFFVTKKRNRVYLNEVNTIPGFTSISMYPKLWEASGVSYPELLDRLIALAIERHHDKSKLNRTFLPPKDWFKV